MKARAGFVSNSSTSSFCVFGFSLNNKINKIMKDKAKAKEEEYEEEYWACSECGYEPQTEKPEFCKRCGGKMETKTRTVTEELDFYDICENLGLVFYDGDSGTVVGLDAEGKSVAQLTKAQEKINKILGINIDCKIRSGEYGC